MDTFAYEQNNLEGDSLTLCEVAVTNIETIPKNQSA